VRIKTAREWATELMGAMRMKIAVIVARVLLGLVFVAAGAVKFMPMKPGSVPPGDMATMVGLMAAHKWIWFYGVFELAAGLMLLVGRFVPLGLTLLAALLINILLFDVTLAPSAVGILLTLVLGALELFLVWAYRESFAGVFAAKAAAKS
jgi:uncharacterized membrane protein YphA (DoxX/SURF4 family)